jgi:glycosyltransferase involved in cell wall biosynthesis
MAAGVPVVASDVGGNPEVVHHGQNGLLVPLDDAAAIKDAVDRLLDDPHLAPRLTRQATQDVAAYRWDELVERTAATLEELARPAPPAGAPEHGAGVRPA